MSDGEIEGAVFVQTNEPQNAVVGFRRATDGALERMATYETEGAGEGEPHLTSQGSVTLTGDRRHLLVTNAASGDVTVFAVASDGDLDIVGRTPAGSSPKSVTEHDGVVYVLSTGTPAVAGFRLTEGGLEPMAGGEHGLSGPDADPAQVGFSPDGSALVVTQRGTNSIASFQVHPDGALGSLEVVASSGPTPYGFAFTSGGTLVVTEAFGAQKGAAAASSYGVAEAAVTPVTKSVGNGRSEICWAVVTKDDRYAFTTNFADGAVSRYAIAPDGTLTLDDATAGISFDGRPGLRDEGLTADGRFLYAIDADSGAIFGWAVGGAGELSPIGSWGGLPTTVAGLAAT
jgi:6-phosphogluconolactonase (cycloisomerase 2 family)